MKAASIRYSQVIALFPGGQISDDFCFSGYRQVIIVNPQLSK